MKSTITTVYCDICGQVLENIADYGYYADMDIKYGANTFTIRIARQGAITTDLCTYCTTKLLLVASNQVKRGINPDA